MERCMDSSTMQAEYPTRDQRVAVCLGSYREAGGKEADVTLETIEEHTDYEDYVEDKKHLDVTFDLKADPDGEEEGTFMGYGSVFKNKDMGNDVVMPGAFAKSLARKGPRGVKMLYQHKADEVIGVYEEILEDDKGLKVKGRLAMGTQRGREVYELMKMGAMDGLSIGYRVDPRKGVEYDDRGKKRLLKEVDLMEISAVTFPMNTRARVSGVKGEERTVREWEAFLREEGGLSRSEAKKAANAVSHALDQREVGDEQNTDLVKSLTKLRSVLQD